MTRMSKRAIRPGFDDLEGRELLSGLMVGGANAAAIVQPPVTPPEPTPLTLSGTITGNYSSASNTYQLIGNGPITVTPPGGNPVTLSAEGSISLPVPGPHGRRFILPNHGDGMLTLSDSQGTLTLELTGHLFEEPEPLQLDFPFLPDRFDRFDFVITRFDFVITGGTGAFANAAGRGMAFLQLDADPNLSGQTGRFSLDLEGPFSPVPQRDES